MDSLQVHLAAGTMGKTAALGKVTIIQFYQSSLPRLQIRTQGQTCPAKGAKILPDHARFKCLKSLVFQFILFLSLCSATFPGYSSASCNGRGFEKPFGRSHTPLRYDTITSKSKRIHTFYFSNFTHTGKCFITCPQNYHLCCCLCQTLVLVLFKEFSYLTAAQLSESHHYRFLCSLAQFQGRVTPVSLHYTDR